MLDPAIIKFLKGLRETWLDKKKTKLGKSSYEEKKSELEQEAKEKYSFENWLPVMLEVADNFFTSHPAKFTHSGAKKVSSITAIFSDLSDGFLKSGNAIAEMDLSNYGNNGDSTELYKFLRLELAGKTIFDHLIEDTKVIQEQLGLNSLSYNEVKQRLVPVRQKKEKSITSEKIRQVYFPVQNEYHLLSLLSPSGLMFGLKEVATPFLPYHIFKYCGEELNVLKEKKKNKKFSEHTFSDLYGLNLMGFGGENKQNVSVLNNQNKGISYLLPSAPPKILKKDIWLPKYDFLKRRKLLNPWNYAIEFYAFHNEIEQLVENNFLDKKSPFEHRILRDQIIQSVIIQVIELSWKIRTLDSGWAGGKEFTNLPEYQKIWLDHGYQKGKEENLDWFERLEVELSRWFISSYRRVVGKKAKEKELSDVEFKHIKGEVKAVIRKNKGGLL